MGVNIKDVEYFIDSPTGIFHAVASSENGWSYTACNSLISGLPEKFKERPKRICRKCQKQLKLATLIQRPSR